MNLTNENIQFELSNGNQITIKADKKSIKQEMKENVIGRLMKTLLQKIRLKRVGRKLFNIKKSVSIQDFEIWPGFSTTFLNLPQKQISLFNIDLVHKIITNKNVFKTMEFHKQKFSNRYQDTLRQELEGTSIMTTYNRKIYRIDKIDFDKSPMDGFENDQGEKIPFKQYYQDRYKLEIKNSNQPLLLHIDKKKDGTTKEIYLIPELCVMTGLSDDNRNNFGLMKSLDNVIKPSAGKRLEKCQDLINLINQNEYTKKFLEEWKLKIETKPLQIDGQQINPGQLLFSNKNVKLNEVRNLNQEAQGEMYNYTNLQDIVIFYEIRSQGDMKKFQNMLITVLQQYNIQFRNIIPVQIHSLKNERDFQEQAKKNLNEDVSICFWILWGKKKQGINYDKIKRYLVNELPVPSQMILSSTIQRDKGFRSVVTKLIIQVGAKLGFIPWTIDELPFTDLPTMIVGIDSYGKSGSNNQVVYGMVTTTDENFSTYWSASDYGSKDFGMSDFIIKNLEKAVQFFVEKNEIVPQRILFFREGVSQGQRAQIKNEEIIKIKEILQKFESDNRISIVYVCVSKISNAKFFYSKIQNDFSNVTNPIQGTYLYKNVCSNENDEFYLISQQTMKGISSPTNYFILQNELTENENMSAQDVKDNLATLIFKLSYLYYNSIGGIKVPSPIIYANRLCNHIGNNSNKNNKMIPHDHLADIESLYFI